MLGYETELLSRVLLEKELKPFSIRDKFCVTFLVPWSLEGDTYERIRQVMFNTTSNEEILPAI